MDSIPCCVFWSVSTLVVLCFCLRVRSQCEWCVCVCVCVVFKTACGYITLLPACLMRPGIGRNTPMVCRVHWSGMHAIFQWQRWMSLSVCWVSSHCTVLQSQNHALLAFKVLEVECEDADRFEEVVVSIVSWTPSTKPLPFTLLIITWHAHIPSILIGDPIVSVTWWSLYTNSRELCLFPC